MLTYIHQPSSRHENVFTMQLWYNHFCVCVCVCVQRIHVQAVTIYSLPVVVTDIVVAVIAVGIVVAVEGKMISGGQSSTLVLKVSSPRCTQVAPGVRVNCIPMTVRLPEISAGKHTLTRDSQDVREELTGKVSIVARLTKSVPAKTEMDWTPIPH